MRLIDALELKRSIACSSILEDGKTLEQIIDEQPTIEPEQRWIPCSERLPEDDIKVLVTDEDGYIYIAYYDYNEWSDDPKIEWWTGEFRIYPIAWMPLPEPWKGEQP